MRQMMLNRLGAVFLGLFFFFSIRQRDKRGKGKGEGADPSFAAILGLW